ncbi:hypothetical protein ABB37_01577 [Leptomonas pyrrhocoris]|uniref:Uncharacterized protein n=1 Tax=Leptomonas pyrrhocoris TaxID=157538 RepID=A0A0M9G9B2_LEPPY|nr:hypothetical protein ABB37_01577 [Leptomonas pyrrhocoris]KPA85219.1 hypothetical protein ABB37_01577 [Leptomonas pyrrhocoris]|eukprot:XP_015663658.1 hypothetical protein ABB37_01577 [Leptomonas pyrrhocoris]
MPKMYKCMQNGSVFCLEDIIKQFIYSGIARQINVFPCKSIFTPRNRAFYVSQLLFFDFYVRHKSVVYVVIDTMGIFLLPVGCTLSEGASATSTMTKVSVLSQLNWCIRPTVLLMVKDDDWTFLFLHSLCRLFPFFFGLPNYCMPLLLCNTGFSICLSIPHLFSTRISFLIWLRVLDRRYSSRHFSVYKFVASKKRSEIISGHAFFFFCGVPLCICVCMCVYLSEKKRVALFPDNSRRYISEL